MVNLHKLFLTLLVCESFMANSLLKRHGRIVNYKTNGGKGQLKNAPKDIPKKWWFAT